MNALIEAKPPLSSKDKRARLEERLRQAAGRNSQSPLSFAQQRLWFLDQLEPNSPIYNVPTVARLTGSLDAPALERALRSIVARHESLRTRFECLGETPTQVINPQPVFKFPTIDVADQAEADRLVLQEVRRPFNLTDSGGLMRATLLRLNAGEHVLILVLHHIVADEWSLKVFFRELAEFYKAQLDGSPCRMPELSIQYADYAVWQRQWLRGESLQRQITYWKEQLDGKPPVTEITTDKPRGPAPTSKGRTQVRAFNRDVSDALKRLAGEKDATLFMLLLAGFKTLIYRYTGLEDIIVGTPISGRNRVETEGLIGFFVNTLLVRTGAWGNPRFDEFLQRVRASALGAYGHQDLPFDKLVEELRPERSLTHLAFTRLMFAVQNRVVETVPLPGVKMELLETDTGTAKFDLTFVVQELDRGLVVRVEYNCDLFNEGTIARLLEHFENLLGAIVIDPSRRLSELSMLGAEERRQLLVDWNNTATDYPRGKCIHELFHSRVQFQPESIAAVFDGQSLTYAELNARANQLAHYLLHCKVAPGTPVAICVERSASMIVGFLAILKAGGAYVPLDPRYPKERLAFLVQDSRTPILLTQHSLLSHLPQLPRGAVKTVCMDADSELIASHSRDNPPPRSSPLDPAYIMYTSGSTGMPKGVAVPHRAVNRLVLNTNYIQLDATDRIAQVSNMAFDAATFEIWGALLNGGQVRSISADIALSPRDFARELHEQGITAMFLTSALFSQLAAEVPGAFKTLRTLIAGGEALEPNRVRSVLENQPPQRLVNGYGPTENTTFTCCHLIREVPDGAGNVPIGRPISNTQVYILDSHRNLVPAGVPGELYTGGDGIALGYWNRPDLNGEKFILHQFGPSEPCQSLYRTGDLARYLPDGTIEFLGRIDNQVKIRGFRIELGEIETVLARHPGVRECAVTTHGTGAGQNRLAAYFVADGKRAPNAGQLRSFLKEKLPDYMVPGAFVQLASLPLTPNGKVDRRALPEPNHARPRSEKKYASPRDAVELELTRIWENILGIEPIGIEDPFFDLGGHSLLVVRMIAQIEKAFGKKLRIATVFLAPTIEQLAAVIRDETRERSVTAGTSLVELQSKGTRPPLFFVHGAGGGMFWGYVNLARRLGEDQPVFGFSPHGPEGGEFATIEAMAARYVRDMRLVQEDGPYYLGGYCFGGDVAFEMARQLEAQGQKVGMLALMNCAPPNSRYLRAAWTPAWCARFFRNLVYWARYCREWTATQRRDFLRWKLARLKHRMARLLGAEPPRSLSVDIENMVDMASLPPEQRKLWENHIRALMNFHPGPYRGRVHLFRSPGHPLWSSFAQDYGWSEVADGGVEVSIVPGAHEKILEEPWVDVTASKLKSVLDGNVPPAETRNLAYWRRQVTGLPALLELPTDHPRPAAQSKNTAAETSALPDALVNERDLSAAFLAALAVVLHRYSGRDDIALGTRVDGSPDVLPLRINLSGNPTAREILARVRAKMSAAMRHQGVPWAALMAEFCPVPDTSFHPLIQIAFDTSADSQNPGFDLRVQWLGDRLRVEYATDLFEPATIRRLLGHLEMATRRMLQAPDAHLSDLSILTGAETELLLGQWNRTEVEYPKEKTLIDLFEEQAARTPEAEALVCGTRRLTYSQLRARAATVANRLQVLGVGKEALVGICLGRSEDMVAGILGTLQAGAAYVPLDPAYPAARLAFIARDAGLTVVLTSRRLLGAIPETTAVVLCVEDIEATRDSAPAVPAATDLAYVLYTSGSTGQPKGVAIEHRSAVALVSWAGTVFSAQELSGVLASTSICFDLSVFEIFVPLSWGGRIILAENALALPALPAANEVSLVNTVPSAMRELLRVHGVPKSVRVVNLAGEPLATTLVDQIYAETSANKVYDLYGPTETTTYSTFAWRVAGEPPTIGRPLANEQVYLLDAQLQPVPIGVPGNLYIGGAGLARGYLNRKELTRESFVPHPFKAGARLYKTGDLARWRADGNLVYLGRSDHQVKLRGFRIELGEIESALKNHPDIADAVVVAREDKPGEKRLAAYIVCHPQKQVSTAQLRSAVREKLPEYMVPSAFVVLEALPLTPNGKVNRKALPIPEQGRESSRDFVAARTPLEGRLSGIWAEVLQVDRVGVTDNFFELGGHSLLAIQVIARLGDALNTQLPLSCLFEAPTIAELAAWMASGQWKPRQNPIPPLEPAPREGELTASFVQEQLWFLNQLDPASDAYNVPAAIRLKGRLDLAALQKSVNHILVRHEALRTTFHSSEGALRQRIEPPGTLEISVSDVGSQSQLDEFLSREARRPFDLERGPLMRALVARITETEHVFVVVMHHAVTDGWSLSIFFHELKTLYRAFATGGLPPQLPALDVQYADFARWQRSWMQGPALDDELRFWKENLAGMPPSVDLPADHRETARTTFAAARRTRRFSRSLLTETSQLARREGGTTFMVLMAALAITLHKWTGQSDMVLGTVVAGRCRREIENLIGCFMNFLPLCAKVTGAETGQDVLRAIKTAVIEGQTHQDCPFKVIVESMNVERRLNANPLYNVALLFQNSPIGQFHDELLDAVPIPVTVQAALLDLRFEADETADGLSLLCEYKADLFEGTTIDRLLEQFAAVLETLAQSPEKKVSDFRSIPELEAQAAAARARVQSQTIAIAGTFTAEPLEEALRYWMNELEIPTQIKFAPFNQVFQQLLDPGSLFSLNERGLNVILIRLQDWQIEGIERNARELVLAVKNAAGRGGAPCLICFGPPSQVIAGDAPQARILEQTEQSLVRELEGLPGVYVVTARQIAQWYPVADYDDRIADDLGRIPYTPLFFTALATTVARKFHALRRAPLKVIALDCDQTLWSGVCGEDGPKGVTIDAARRALQQFVLRQREAGMLLALCSKNSEEDVQAVFAEHPEMPLQAEHLTASRVNWLPKSENLRSLAQELNLGLESIILIDDNPLECAEVESGCPEARTLQLPGDPALIPRFLEHCWIFDKVRVTDEDRRRADLYRQNQRREEFKSQSLSFADFLAGLDLKIQFQPMSSAQLPRVAQLTLRTNQFNSTGRRRTESQLRQLDGQSEVLTVSVSDRFGDHGLVGAMIFETADDAIIVDSILLSCRALGRGVEERMLAELGAVARRRGARWVDVRYECLPRNKPALDFLERFGAPFKHANNGANRFLFPADVAAEVVIRPRDAEPQGGKTRPLQAEAPGSKFTRCRAIALESLDVAEIHRKIQASTVPRPAGKIKTGFVAPRTPMEKQLCPLWENLLRVERIGIRDDFFDLGGHSLLAVHLFAQVEKITGQKLPLVTLFQAPTIEQLASVLDQGGGAPSRSLLVPMQPRGNKPPLFLVHGAGGDVLWGYANLIAHMEPDQPVYAIKSRGQTGLEEFEQLEEMAAFYVREARSLQPEGPYFLGGYCFGGNVAYEMARQLRAAGQEVALLALIDSAPANAGYEAVAWWRPAFPYRFARNLYYWLGDFKHIGPRDRRRFVARKLRAAGRRLARLFRPNEKPAVDLEQVIDPAHFPESELKLWRIHLRALGAHSQRPYPGKVTLFRTRGHPVFSSFAEDFCWGKLTGGVAIRQIPGSHERIFIEPHVKTLALSLTASLAEKKTMCLTHDIA
jgi:amino acid adenylation domain-containing protein/FkbH-like protein